MFSTANDRSVTLEQVKSRNHNYMLPFFNAIGKKVMFHEQGEVGILTEIGEDDHDYWIKVMYGEYRHTKFSPLERWNFINELEETVFGVFYNSMTYESDFGLISLHKTKVNAVLALKKHKDETIKILKSNLDEDEKDTSEEDLLSFMAWIVKELVIKD